MIRARKAAVKPTMSLSIHILPETCQNGSLALLRRRSLRRDTGMTQSNTPKLRSGDLEPAELARLLVTVGDSRSVDAFETLFRFYSPKVRAFMAMKTKDRQAAEELMQETMSSVWTKAAQFDPDRGNASAWIFTIARNIRIDAYRRKRPVLDVDDQALVPEEVPQADRELEKSQEATLLRNALAALPPEQQDVLKMAFFEDKPHSAIAEQMGLPLGTVKSRIRLAFSKLRDALEDRR